MSLPGDHSLRAARHGGEPCVCPQGTGDTGLAGSPDDGVITGKGWQVSGAVVKCHFPNTLGSVPSQPCSGTGGGETPDLASEASYPSGGFSSIQARK